MLLDAEKLDLIANRDQRLDPKIRHGIFLEGIGKDVTWQDIINVFNQNRYFREGRIDWIKFIKITKYEAELLLPLYQSDFFNTHSLAFQATKKDVIETLMTKEISKKINRLYLECLDLKAVQAAMDRINNFDIQTLYLKFLPMDCLDEIAYSLKKNKTTINKIFLTKEGKSRETFEYRLDEFLYYVESSKARSQSSNEDKQEKSERKEPSHGLSEEAPYSGKKRSREEEDKSVLKNVRRRKEGDTDVSSHNGAMPQYSEAQEQIATNTKSNSSPPLTLTEQQAIAIKYLETVEQERNIFQYEKYMWESEKFTLIENEKQLLAEVEKADMQIKQLEAELDSYKRSKAQTQSILVSLMQSQGMSVPQNNLSVVANHPATMFSSQTASFQVSNQATALKGLPNTNYQSR